MCPKRPIVYVCLEWKLDAVLDFVKHKCSASIEKQLRHLAQKFRRSLATMVRASEFWRVLFVPAVQGFSSGSLFHGRLDIDTLQAWASAVYRLWRALRVGRLRGFLWGLVYLGLVRAQEWPSCQASFPIWARFSTRGFILRFTTLQIGPGGQHSHQECWQSLVYAWALYRRNLVVERWSEFLQNLWGICRALVQQWVASRRLPGFFLGTNHG